jgi:hypothetical protein
MSLILEALRKLDRERAEPRGFLVVAGESEHRGRRGLWGLAALVAVVLLGVGVYLYGLRARPSPSGTAAAPAEAPRAAAPSPSSAPLPVPPPVQKAAQAPRVAPLDRPVPLVPPALPKSPEPSPSASPATFVLEAISTQNGEPVAVVNGRLVREGDTVDGARIVKIRSDSVELVYRGSVQVLPF